MDGPKFRRHVVMGWAFRNLTDAQKEGISQYLQTGDPSTLPINYQHLRTRLRTEPGKYKV